MASAQYLVVLHNNEWTISLNGRYYGPFATQSMAVSAAIEAVQTGKQKGQEAQVLVQGKDNQFHTEALYGYAR